MSLITFGKSELDYVDDYKYLGVTIESRLTLSKNINKTISAVSHKTSQLYKIRKSISPRTALQLYKTMLLPIIDFGDLFYHIKNTKLINKLQILQNRRIRIISNLPKLTNTTIEQRKLDLLSLCERRALHIIQFALGLNRSQLETFRPAKALTEKSLSYTMRKAWNSLPTAAHLPDKQIFTKYLLVNSKYLIL